MSNKIIIKTISTGLLVFLLAGLAAAVLFANAQRNKAKEQHEIADKLAGNYKALSGEFQTYEIETDKQLRLSAAKSYRASVEIEEWKRQHKQDAALIRKMGVNINNLASITTATTITRDTITVEKIIIKNKILDSLIFGKERSFMRAKVWINNEAPEHSTMSYQYTDSLLLTNEFEQKKFWFIKLGKKFKTAHLISKDPNCQISGFEYMETIE